MDLSQKRILLTGGSGFLGSAVADSLTIRGCDIKRLPPYIPGLIAVNLGEPTYADAPGAYIPRSQHYDLTQGSACQQVMQGIKPHLVLHLAALTGGIGANQAAPADFFYKNLMMGVQLLHESHKSGVEKFVGLGTICSYPRDTPVPFREETVWDGYPEITNAPYGLAKKMLLVQAQAYRQQYGFNAIHLMPTNLYGPGDNFDLQTSHVIPALISKFIVARDRELPNVTVWGTGQATREFLFVQDAAEAVVRAAESYDSPEPLNIGSGQEIKIYDLVRLIKQLVEYKGAVMWDDSRPDGQPRRCLDVSKARQKLGFAPQTGLRDGLIQTIQWFEQHIYPTLTK